MHFPVILLWLKIIWCHIKVCEVWLKFILIFDFFCVNCNGKLVVIFLIIVTWKCIIYKHALCDFVANNYLIIDFYYWNRAILQTCRKINLYLTSISKAYLKCYKKKILSSRNLSRKNHSSGLMYFNTKKQVSLQNYFLTLFYYYCVIDVQWSSTS